MVRLAANIKEIARGTLTGVGGEGLVYVTLAKLSLLAKLKILLASVFAIGSGLHFKKLRTADSFAKSSLADTLVEEVW